MSLAILRHSIKSNWALFLTILALLIMYMSVIITMYDPGSLDAMAQLLDVMPKQLVASMGFDKVGSSLTGFLAGYYYGFIIILFPMIYCIVLSNRLIARFVDRGSMAYMLASPVNRTKVATTQAVYFVVSMSLMLFLNACFGLMISATSFPGLLDVGKFILLNAVALAMFLALAGIGFFFSCLFDDTKLSTTFGSGLPLLFFVVNMLANVDSSIGWLKNFTLFSLFNTNDIMAGSSFVPVAAGILIVVAAAGFIGGIVSFSRRNLAL
jgi:ABC-2 type transport system permease protein